MDLVSPVLRTDFREFCVSYLVLRQIHDIFTMAGVKQGIPKTDRPISGQRRTLVEEYYASINWTNEQDVDKFLRVVGYTIAQSYLTSVDKKYLQEICEREGFVVDGINIYRKPNQTKPFVMPVKPSDLTKLREDLLIVSKLDPQQRGFAFEKFLNALFALFGLAPRNFSDSLVSRLMAAFKLTPTHILWKQSGKQSQQHKMICLFSAVRLRQNPRGRVVSLSATVALPTMV